MNITYLELGIQQYTIKALRELEIKERLNEHISLHMTALLYDVHKDTQLYDTKAGTQIILQQKQQETKLLFQGVVRKIAIEKSKEYIF